MAPTAGIPAEASGAEMPRVAPEQGQVLKPRAQSRRRRSRAGPTSVCRL